MTTISSTTVKLRIRKGTDGMSPLYSVELLSGVATQMNSSGVEVPYVGNATLWIQDPAGTKTQNTVACGSPNGAWKYFNSNNKTGTWTATIHVPAGTGTNNAVSTDFAWEVGSSIATAQ